mgnify:CR=1 FL=1
MKKIILLLLIVTGITNAQIVDIPDANFKNKLIALGVDTNIDGEIQESEAMAITSLDVSSSTISDLTGIEAFENLEFLDCGGNLLSTLDVSNNIALATLYCYNNDLTLLDCNNNSNLTELILTNNLNLTTVFLKNGSDESSNMGTGSWLENWIDSNNPSLEYICADDFQIADIQQYLDADVNINSYCNFEPGGDYNTITGSAKFDTDADGCDDIDPIIPYMAIHLDLDGTSTNATFFTNTQGQYTIYTGETGTYSLIPNLENPSYYTVIPSPAEVIIPIIDNSTILQDFCVTADGIHPDLEVVIAPIIPARPGFEATYQLVYKNKGNQSLSGDVMFTYEDALLDFVSASTVPDIQATGLLGFNFSDLQPFQNESVEIILSVNSPADTPPVNIDDVLIFSATVNPIAGDEAPDDNIFNYDQIVVGSYDPNNMICIQGDLVPAEMIGEYLHYVINFENTGNYPAENVVVVVEINPEDFDINTLQVLNASHEVDITIDNGTVEFIFRNIDLDTGGHGNILLKMETNGDLDVSDMVSAMAAIYFDFNLPIVTNDANTEFQILGINAIEFESSIAIFPNPAKDLLNIQAESEIQTVTIYDMQGRTVYTELSNKEQMSIHISDLTQGVYFLKINTTEGEEVRKIIKN